MVKTGKIFKDSDNIYQDQARLLFDYYSRAAESIIGQEEKIEGEIARLNQQREETEHYMAETSRKWWCIFSWLGYILFGGKKKCEEKLAKISESISKQEKAHKDIFRDYRVEKMGVVYVPVAQQVAYEDKCFVVDHTGQVPLSEITLQQSRQTSLLTETMSQLEKLSAEAPVVETSKETEVVPTDELSRSIQEVPLNDYVGKLDRSLRTISFCMSDTETKSVSLPLVLGESELKSQLDEFATSETSGHPVVNVFDDQRYKKEIDDFCELNRLKESLSNDTEQFEDTLKHLMHSIAASVQTISAMKLASTRKLVAGSNNLLLKLLKAPYNHYSTRLEFDEIDRIRKERFDYSDSIQGYEPFQLRESSRVRYNLFAGEWTAEDNSVDSVPFGIHQIYEEIVAPMVQRLMAENRIQRISIYGQIHDQKVDYLNKWHQDVDAFYRSNHAESADIINNMQQTLSEYTEAFNTLTQLEKTLKSMEQGEQSLDKAVVQQGANTEETLAAFEAQGQEFRRVQEEFSEYMDRLQEDVALKAEKFGYIELYDARLRDGYSNAAAVAASEVPQMDERRKPLASANPLLGKEAQLLPEPSVEDVAFEQLSMNIPALAVNALDAISRIATEKQPAAETPETEAPAAEAPEAEDPAPETPETEAPVAETPETEAPAAEVPAAEAPETEAPAAEAPATEAPETEAPETEAPETEAPETEAPAAEAPAPEAPAAEDEKPLSPQEKKAQRKKQMEEMRERLNERMKMSEEERRELVKKKMEEKREQMKREMEERREQMRNMFKRGNKK